MSASCWWRCPPPLVAVWMARSLRWDVEDPWEAASGSTVVTVVSFWAFKKAHADLGGGRSVLQSLSKCQLLRIHGHLCFQLGRQQAGLWRSAAGSAAFCVSLWSRFAAIIGTKQPEGPTREDLGPWGGGFLACRFMLVAS